MRIPHAKFQNSVWTPGLSGVCAMGLMLCTPAAGATEPAVPWECTAFAGEAQARCIQTFVELQQEKIAKLEKDLQSPTADGSATRATRCATSIGHS